MFTYAIIALATTFLTFVLNQGMVIWSLWRIHCDRASAESVEALAIHNIAMALFALACTGVFLFRFSNGELMEGGNYYLIPGVVILSNIFFTVSSLRTVCEWSDKDKRAQAEGHGNTDRIY